MKRRWKNWRMTSPASLISWLKLHCVKSGFPCPNATGKNPGSPLSPTGNWAGKTVDSACGQCKWHGALYTVVDIPGAYSLTANSKDEEAAADFILNGGADAVIVVCDATCLERNLFLALQIMNLKTDKFYIRSELLFRGWKQHREVQLNWRWFWAKPKLWHE